MLIGVPKEIKNHEYRVGLTPAAVRELVLHGHRVLVETEAGAGSGYEDAHYLGAGAEVVADAQAVFARAELLVKVKEPQPAEYLLLRDGQWLFTYLHLAPDRAQADALLRSGCSAIAYETVTDGGGGLPLLAPMSEVAGRLAVQTGARCLEKPMGGRGVLLGGVPGVPPGRVVVLGGGVVGSHAAQMAIGLGARVTVIGRSLTRLRALAQRFGPLLETLHSTAQAIEDCVLDADLVIGAVLIAGAATPKLVSRDVVRRMRPGSVIVDVAIDQGGCCETSRATTHAAPTYLCEGVVHSCVANMPSAVARTATAALNNATLPFVLALADRGCRQALADDPHLRRGLNVHAGLITCAEVAEALDYAHMPPVQALGLHAPGADAD
jgi:alanine dehydrogenase